MCPAVEPTITSLKIFTYYCQCMGSSSYLMVLIFYRINLLHVLLFRDMILEHMMSVTFIMSGQGII